DAAGRCGELRIACPRRIPKHATKPYPVALAKQRDSAPAITRRSLPGNVCASIDTVQVTWPFLRTVVNWRGRSQSAQRLQECGAEERAQIFERRQIDLLAGAGALAVPQRHEDGERGARPRCHVGIGESPPYGLAAAVTHQVGVTRQCL